MSKTPQTLKRGEGKDDGREGRRGHFYCSLSVGIIWSTRGSTLILGDKVWLKHVGRGLRQPFMWSWLCAYVETERG